MGAGTVVRERRETALRFERFVSGFGRGTETCSCTMIQCPPRFSQTAVCLPFSCIVFPSFWLTVPLNVFTVQARFPRRVTFRSSSGVNEALAALANTFLKPSLYFFQPL